MVEDGEFDFCLWVMVCYSYDEMKDNFDGYLKIDIGNYYFICWVIKFEVDGVFGVFGVWLLWVYNDKKGFIG